MKRKNGESNILRFSMSLFQYLLPVSVASLPSLPLNQTMKAWRLLCLVSFTLSSYGYTVIQRILKLKVINLHEDLGL
jgi:hypothetical protein